MFIGLVLRLRVNLLSMHDYSLDFGAFFWNSWSFIASPMLPCTFNLPWKNAFWEFSFPVIRSTRSPSEMVSVTSGLAKKTCLPKCMSEYSTFAIELDWSKPVLGVHNPKSLLVVRSPLHLEPIDSLHLTNKGLPVFGKGLWDCVKDLFWLEPIRRGGHVDLPQLDS